MMEPIQSDARRLLLVEDNEGDAKIVLYTLQEAQSARFNVTWVSTLADAFGEWGKQDFDVVLLDLSLPDSSGLQTLTAMRELAPNVPIVVATGSDDINLGIQTLRLGAQEFLLKGRVSGEMVVRELLHAIERQRFDAEMTQYREQLESMVEQRTRELQKAVHSLEALNRARSEFVQNVSHELKTPLTSMSYAIENLLDGVVGQIPDRVNEYIMMLEEDCQRLRRTVADILDLSRIDTNSLVLNRAVIAMNSFCESIIEAMQRYAESRGVELTMSTEGTPMFVNGDARKIERAVNNVLQNGIKFTSQGGKVHFHVAPCTDAASAVCLTVTDTGIGIPQEHISQVTDRYFRVGSHVDGSGLGLAITREVVEHHGGTLHLVSPPAGQSEGTEVKLRLPACPAPKILVVDDEEYLRKIMVHQLGADGYVVATCGSVEEAWSALSVSRPDLMLVDLVLPGQNGVDFIVGLKRDNRWRAIPVIAMTGAQLDAARRGVLENFGVPCLLKPWDSNTLRRMVNQQIQDERDPAAATESPRMAVRG